MDTLRDKNAALIALIKGVSDKIKALVVHLEKDGKDKSCLSSTADAIGIDFFEIDKIIQENKSLFYRFVPLDKDFFNEPGKTKFRDQYHKLVNYLHGCTFAVVCLKELSKDIFDNKEETLKLIGTINKNIDGVKELLDKINSVAYEFIDQDKQLFEIISELKKDNKVYKILIVDDVEGTLHYCQRLLENQGFVTFTASNVGEAIKSIKENGPDIVLLDLNLDISMDGFEVLKFIRNNNLLIKCIVNTVLDNQELLGMVNALKPEKILIKPFDNNQLLSQINAVIRGSKT